MFVQIQFTTATEHEAATIARSLVEDRLVACVQILAPMTSVYTWKENIHTATECLCLAKTTAESVEAVKTRIASLHSYEVPEIIVLKIVDATLDYFQWIADTVRNDTHSDSD